jgi:hypothetical protein
MNEYIFFCLSLVSLTLLIVDSLFFWAFRELIVKTATFFDNLIGMGLFFSYGGEYYFDVQTFAKPAKYLVECYACTGFWVGFLGSLYKFDLFHALGNGLVVSLFASIVGTNLKFIRLMDTKTREDL